MKETNAIQGFTLIEVLVTLVILAIGMLGLAGLQLSALRNNTNAYERSQATLLAYDIIDRARANSSESYAIAMGTEPTNVHCYGSAKNCTPAELAESDINQWKCSLGAWQGDTDCQKLANDLHAITTMSSLTNGDGSITIEADGRLTVTITWDETHGGATTSFTITTVI